MVTGVAGSWVWHGKVELYFLHILIKGLPCLSQFLSLI